MLKEIGVLLAPILKEIGVSLANRLFGKKDVFACISIYKPEKSSQCINKKREEYTLEYKHNKTKNLSHIEPSMPYLDKIKKNGVIEPIYYFQGPFSWDFPHIEFKVVNNRNDTLMIHNVKFKNIKSIIDPSPVLFMRESDTDANARHIKIFNAGWGAIKNLRIKLSILVNSDNEIQQSCVEYSHELFIGDINDNESSNVDLSNVLKDYGFISDVKNFTPPSDLYIDPHYIYKKVYGEFLFDGISYDKTTQSYSVKFKTNVYLYKWNRPAAYISPSRIYGDSVKFETDNDNYNAPIVEVGHGIKPKECDSFVVKIETKKSSYHEFEIELETDFEPIILPKTTLLTFVPRF